MAAGAVHHVGIAVADLDAAVDAYRDVFGAKVVHRAVVPGEGIEVALLAVGSGRVELLAALGPETPVGRFLAARGPGMHHLAVEVEDVAAELERLAAAGVELVDERPRLGVLGLEIAFVHPHATGGVLAELVGRGRD